MADFPNSDLTADHLNEATDDPSQARVELYNAILKANAIIDGTVVSATANTAVLRDANGHIKAKQLISEVAIGTPPLSVVSTTVVPNLRSANAGNADNADAVGGFKTKVIAIGDWNMDSTGTLNVAHGLTLSKIRDVGVMIITDGSAFIIPLVVVDGLGAVQGSISQVNATEVRLYRIPSGLFDGTAYNATGFNRGWITITYEA